jgi:putative serine protease PepD
MDQFGSSQQVEGEGSGVIIRPDGYILTNNHVVEGSDSITVRIGTEDLVAKVVGADPSSDLAVIRVDRKGLSAAKIGSSEALQVGQTVVAFGSPFGLDKTVTSGIISALHRTDMQQTAERVTAYTNLIQTDAAINPGNSGGPLTDILGRVIGINTLIQTGGAQQSAGIGFAIPIDFARNVADQLIKTGKVQHPFMGVSTSNVDGQNAPSGTAPVSQGALVEEVVPGSPADKAGIKAGDIIVKIDDTVVTGFEDVFAAVRSHNVGETVTVSIVDADGAKRQVEVTLATDTQTQ